MAAVSRRVAATMGVSKMLAPWNRESASAVCGVGRTEDPPLFCSGSKAPRSPNMATLSARHCSTAETTQSATRKAQNPPFTPAALLQSARRDTPPPPFTTLMPSQLMSPDADPRANEVLCSAMDAELKRAAVDYNLASSPRLQDHPSIAPFTVLSDLLHDDHVLLARTLGKEHIEVKIEVGEQPGDFDCRTHYKEIEEYIVPPYMTFAAIVSKGEEPSLRIVGDKDNDGSPPAVLGFVFGSNTKVETRIFWSESLCEIPRGARNAFLKYLKVRGITKGLLQSIANHLRQNRIKRHVKWLKNMKDFFAQETPSTLSQSAESETLPTNFTPSTLSQSVSRSVMRSNEDLVNALDEAVREVEIENQQGTSVVCRIPELIKPIPDEREIPFEIEFHQETQSVLFSRDMGSERITVEGRYVGAGYSEDEDGDIKLVDLLVTISKQGNRTMVLYCNAFLKKIETIGFGVCGLDPHCEDVEAVLTKQLRRSFNQFLELRGVDSKLIRFTAAYLIMKAEKDATLDFSDLKNFIKS